MHIRCLTLAAMLFACVSAFSQTELPAKMQGKYNSQSGRSGDATIGLVKQESPDKARVRIDLTNTVNAHGINCGFSAIETDAVKTDGAWKFSFPSVYCKSNWTMTIKPVEGKNRFEGAFVTDFPSSGTVHFEW